MAARRRGSVLWPVFAVGVALYPFRRVERPKTRHANVTATAVARDACAFAAPGPWAIGSVTGGRADGSHEQDGCPRRRGNFFRPCDTTEVNARLFRSPARTTLGPRGGAGRGGDHRRSADAASGGGRPGGVRDVVPAVSGACLGFLPAPRLRPDCG